MMKIWFASVGLLGAAMLSAPAYADMTVKSEDGTLELALPNGWHEAKPEGRQSKIVATDGKGSRVVIRVYPKEDFKDAKTVATFTMDKLKLSDNEGTKSEEIKVNGQPATRLNVKGTQSNGMRAGFIITVFESNGQYFDVMGRSDASDFDKQQEVLADFANQLKIAGSGESGGHTSSSKPEPAPGKAEPAPGKSKLPMPK